MKFSTFAILFTALLTIITMLITGIWWMIIAVPLGSWLGYEFSQAPNGHEDDEGFHYGDKK
jgi:hypothetical protein